MNRVAVVVLTLAVIAGSVPAAATLAADTPQDSETEPGAAFAGVVGVQQAEVDNEVAERSLAQRFAAAAANDSKARVVADQSQRLADRLDELEAEKARLEQARENGSIGQGEYKAHLAALAAEIRAVERRANRTATVAQSLPDEALQANGANVSEVRRIAQQANRTGGGDVAEAARSIAGKGVGDGLRGPPNASERGPPEGVGGPPDGVGPNQNETDSPGNGNAAGAAGNATGPDEAGPPNRSIGGENKSTGPPNGAGEGNNAANRTSGPPDSVPNVNGTAGNATPDRGNVTERVSNATRGVANATSNVTDRVPNATGSNGTVPGLNGTAPGRNGTAPGLNSTSAEPLGTATDSEVLNEGDGDEDDVLGDDTETESTPTATP